METVRAVLDMGSNLLKFTMGRGYQRMMLKATKAAYPETIQHLLIPIIHVGKRFQLKSRKSGIPGQQTLLSGFSLVSMASS